MEYTTKIFRITKGDHKKGLPVILKMAREAPGLKAEIVTIAHEVIRAAHDPLDLGYSDTTEPRNPFNTKITMGILELDCGLFCALVHRMCFLIKAKTSVPKKDYLGIYKTDKGWVSSSVYKRWNPDRECYVARHDPVLMDAMERYVETMKKKE